MLFTAVADYNGGTYVSQVSAPDPRSALARWLDQHLSNPDFPWCGEDLTTDLEDILDIAVLEGLDSVWSTSVLLGEELLILNIIATHTAEPRN